MLDLARRNALFVASFVLVILSIINWQPCHGQSLTGPSTSCGHVDCAKQYDGFPEFDIGCKCDACSQSSSWQDHSPPTSGSSTAFGSLAWKKGSWEIVPYGFLTGEAIASDSSFSAQPFVLFVNNDIGTDEKQFNVHGQTTALGFKFKGPEIGSLQAGGNIMFNFLGDRPLMNQSTPFLLRAYGFLKNEQWRFGFGVGPDIFGALNPNTVNFGGHLQAGNISAFRGQLRVERYFQATEQIHWTAMGAISQQVVSDFATSPTNIGTDNGWPNIEGRLLLALGQSDGGVAPFQLGASGVIGETRAIGLTDRNVSSTWGISIDGQLDLGRWGARCEVFTGEAIGTYNAAIGQSLNPEDGEAIATVGGFGEVWCKPTDKLTWHVGYGTDDPDDQDLGQILGNTGTPIAGQKSRNTVCWTNLMWDVTDSFQLAFEVSRRETDYIAPSVSNEAMIYHFRTRLTF